MKKYTKTAMQQNMNPQWANRVGYVDWVKITDCTADNIKIAKAGELGVGLSKSNKFTEKGFSVSGFSF